MATLKFPVPTVYYNDTPFHWNPLRPPPGVHPKTWLSILADSLESLFREIRSFGEGLVYITQHPSLTPIYLTGNSNTLIILGLQNEDDVTAAKKALFLQRDEEAKFPKWKLYAFRCR